MLEKLRIFSAGYRVVLYQSSNQNLYFVPQGFVTSARFCCIKDEMKRHWNKPEGESELRIYNSLTKEKVGKIKAR